MGVKIIISATTSDNLRILKDEVTEQELILIDITSTAAELAVSDNVFRLVPNDNATALAINSNLVSNGIQKLAILYRNDIWGSNLSQTLKNDFESQGGEVIAFLDYDARLPEINMDDAIEELNSRITTALPTGAQIAVELFSYEEGIDILKKSSSFESLSKICWYGSDGLIKNQNLLQTPDAAEFAATVGIYCPTIGELSTSQFITIQKQIEDRLGYSFQTNAILMVDAVTIAVQALETAEDGIDNLKNTIFEITENTEGITGDLSLNSSGDRIDCLYDFWGVVKTDTDYNWQKK
jgi:branched-chain amino acid transport system substrate-binding protein